MSQGYKMPKEEGYYMIVCLLPVMHEWVGEQCYFAIDILPIVILPIVINVFFITVLQNTGL